MNVTNKQLSMVWNYKAIDISVEKCTPQLGIQYSGWLQIISNSYVNVFILILKTGN